MHSPGDPACPECDEGWPVPCRCSGLEHKDARGECCDHCGRTHMMTTAIIKLKPEYLADVPAALQTLAQFALDTYGRGGSVDYDVIENALGYACTRVDGENPGYIRVLIDEEYGAALESLQAAGGHPVSDLIRVEAYGQDMVNTGTEEEPVLEEQPVTWTETIGGEPVTRRLGRIS